MKKLALTVCLALAAGSAFAKDWKVIRFGVDASYAPFESKAADGKLVGFDIDLGNAICEKMKAKCVWVENDFDGMIPALKAKKFDGILSALSVTEKRAEQIAFSDKMYNSPVRMIAKKGSPLQPTAESLRGKRVGVEQGSTQEAYAKVYWEPKGVNVVPYQNQDLVLSDLQSGRLDASLQDAVQADIGFLRTPRGNGFAFAGPEVNDVKILGTGTAIGLRKEDTDLRQQINQALAAIHQDGTFQRLAKKYFSFDIYH
ncbi:ABC transporter substrate-binding protein [Pseudogulbenkiania sp. MAI-1]|uniref:ABC transporter substrate-binding protein n=1 Tax=Pseudogulbenkiania sp. MAI-1 TaxID=990370 RepID=UPI00045E5B7B|nr:ABC transporter substrate-binding protein [Pseudogulbenkiania sp. MAI-1]